ncbi:MAG TPA: hypothetical protein PLW77_02170 [Bacteroidales bacterium]|nr:hypothetical protein [Bacteroidales bacterium]HQB22208.1 hypothetical protein [Bacteroidales bacterium]
MKTLNDIEKKNNFKVPEDYFDNVEKEIIDKINSDQVPKKPTPYQILKPYLYMATAVLILAIGFKGMIKISANKQDKKIITETNEANYTFDDMVSELSYYDDMALYEYINDENDDYWNSELITNDEDLAYLEDYLTQNYLEYELE